MSTGGVSGFPPRDGANKEEKDDASAPPAQARIVERILERAMFVAAESPKVRRIVTPFIEIGIALAFVMLAVPSTLRVLTIA